jgi:quercetin dioxygenase-like cupin family protein
MLSHTATRPDCIECGEVVDLNIGLKNDKQSCMIVQSEDLQVRRFTLPAGAELPPQRALGDATLQCLDGALSVTIDGLVCELAAGQLIFLPAKSPHSIKAVERSTLLATMVVPHDKPRRPFDEVQEASEESFPASDPPAYG